MESASGRVGWTRTTEGARGEAAVAVGSASAVFGARKSQRWRFRSSAAETRIACREIASEVGAGEGREAG
jgi:hypothetical protein